MEGSVSSLRKSQSKFRWLGDGVFFSCAEVENIEDVSIQETFWMRIIVRDNRNPNNQKSVSNSKANKPCCKMLIGWVQWKWYQVS